MVLKKLCCFIYILFASVVLFAQDVVVNNKMKMPFGSINTVGILEGQKGTAFQLQTINGLHYNSWFAGLGLGMDYYHFKSIPVFLDVRKKLFNTAVPLYVYADAGVHFTLRNDSEDDWTYSRFNDGFIYDAGIAYTFPVKRNYEFILSAGYSEKRVMEDRFTKYYCINPPCNDNKENYDYKFRRISVKAGVSF